MTDPLLNFAPQPHPCEREGCAAIVEFDDEPFCFPHSPDAGSYMAGYSWKARHP